MLQQQAVANILIDHHQDWIISNGGKIVFEECEDQDPIEPFGIYEKYTVIEDYCLYLSEEVDLFIKIDDYPKAHKMLSKLLKHELVDKYGKNRKLNK